MLAESLATSLKEGNRKRNLQTAFKKRELDDLRLRVVSIVISAAALETAPYEVFGGSEKQLTALYQAIQFQRNDAVHPMTAKVSEDSVRLAYLAFPYALRKSEDLRAWFRANQNII